MDFQEMIRKINMRYNKIYYMKNKSFIEGKSEIHSKEKLLCDFENQRYVH